MRSNIWIWIVLLLQAGPACSAGLPGLHVQASGPAGFAPSLRCDEGKAPVVTVCGHTFVPKGLLPWPDGFTVTRHETRCFAMKGRIFYLIEVASQSAGTGSPAFSKAFVLDRKGRDTGIGFFLAFDNPCGQSYRARWSVRQAPGKAAELRVDWIDWPREKPTWGQRGKMDSWPVCGDLNVGTDGFLLAADGRIIPSENREYRVLAGLRPASAPALPGRDSALRAGLAALNTGERVELARCVFEWRNAITNPAPTRQMDLKERRAFRSLTVLLEGLKGKNAMLAGTRTIQAGRTSEAHACRQKNTRRLQANGGTIP